MTRTWTKIIRRGGDANIGAALTRLAQQAVSVHMFEAADRQARMLGPAGGTDAGLSISHAMPLGVEGRS